MLRRGDETDFPAELLLWLSPSFPVGSFAYSHGLETEVAEGRITDAETLADWLQVLTVHGSLHNDLILLSLAYRAEDAISLRGVSDLACALQPSAERSAEALVQGENFRAAYLAGWTNGGHTRFDELGRDASVTLAVAVSIAASDRKLPLLPTLEAYALGFHSNLVSAAIRLNIIGQFDGQRILASLLPEMRSAAKSAEFATEDDLGNAALAVDIASMKHETQKVRLFRS
ncbi:MAG TPA: urease accessory UreF family protein [Hyphomicrobiales bacterium]|nr:urease accessory UreF family protein [Hyphomicrobiales bacterium]